MRSGLTIVSMWLICKSLRPLSIKIEDNTMDIEFHYYMTYLIAARAGFPAEEAITIAHSSQYVDDNNVTYRINKDTAEDYENYISQTMNILKPKLKLLRIYPLFHFIPGEPNSETAQRKDGKQHLLNTTPNSKNANVIMDQAISTGDLYHIGIAAHAYVDTWAHQNFIGYYDDFNGMKGPLNAMKPNIGHADAEHNPDWPALAWKDPRLLTKHQRIDNKVRFIEAAENLFHKLVAFKGVISEADIPAICKGLCDDLREDIGDRDQSNKFKESRIARYKKRAELVEYGDARLLDFDDDEWFDDVINENVRGLKDRNMKTNAFLRLDPFRDEYTWKDTNTYRDTHWYKFQQAVKKHQDIAWGVLEESTFNKMELEAL